ncbi:MAG: hypothetical protein WB565_14280 [Acidimicrobiales bacterium]
MWWRAGDDVVGGDYKDLFVAIAGASGALTGLLFVALSVTGGRETSPNPPIIQQVRAAAALVAFVNALAVSLFGLVPGTHLAYPAIVLGFIGLVYTAAAIRSIVTSEATRRQIMGQMWLVLLLLLIFGGEIAAGITLLASPAKTGAEQIIGYALVTSLLVGVARAWELVGERGTGLFSSVAELTGHRHFPGGTSRPATQSSGGASQSREGDGPSSTTN